MVSISPRWQNAFIGEEITMMKPSKKHDICPTIKSVLPFVLCKKEKTQYNHETI